ncbi:MAG: tetratricopeptide repeat protein [Terrimicrobiaceae bacterium]
MNASVSRLSVATLVAILATAFALPAQDVVVQKDQQRREGEILGVADGKLRIKIGPAETSLPMDQVASVVKAPPKAYDDALKMWQEGNANKALGLLRPIVETFRGLPTDWAERSSALLGDVYLSIDEVAAAETAFAEFTKAYPNAKSLSDIGLVRLAVARKDFASAKSKLTPVVAEAESVIPTPAGKRATFGQAFYLMGIIHENEGAYPEALRDYLSAVTLFPDDKAVVAKAQERADFLIKEKQVIVP